MSQKASDRERLFNLGVDKYFTKPFSQSDLLDCIQNNLVCEDKLAGNKKKLYNMASVPITFNVPSMYKILLVEDNLVNQEVAISMLAKKGHTVVIANNGEEAVALYRKDAYDFILMDVQMPVMNGYEATENIREIEKNNGQHTPIIGLAANAMKGDREKCIEAGMDDYLSKPVGMNELFTVLETVQKAVADKSAEGKPLVNLTTLLENLEGDTDSLESILEKYEARAMQQMKEIEMYVDNGDVTHIVMPAHTLKGQCMHVEMHTVVALAGQVEALAKENKFQELKALMPSLQSELTLGLQALVVARMELLKEKVA